MTAHGRTERANTARDAPSRRAATRAPILSFVTIFLAIALAAEIYLEVLHILYLQIVTFHPLPLNDEWGTMALFSAMEDSPPSWNLLLWPHLEHRPLLPRLIYLLDVKLADATGALCIVAIDCMQLAVAATWVLLLARKSGQGQQRPLVMPYFAALCIVAILFSGRQMQNFVWGFQVMFIMVYFFATLSFALFGLAMEHAANDRTAAYLLFLSCVFGACAALSMANGLFVLPNVFVMAFLRRRDLRPAAVLTIGIVTGVTIAFYFSGPGQILGRSYHKIPANMLLDVVTFFFAFLGGPWATIVPGGASVAGLVTLLLAVYALVTNWRRGGLRSYETVATGMIVLVLVSAAAAALGRVEIGIATDSRYSTAVLMLYAGIIVSFWPRLSGYHEPARPCGPGVQPRCRNLAIPVFLVLGTLAYGAASHWRLPYEVSELPNIKANAEVAYVGNVQDPDAIKPVAMGTGYVGVPDPRAYAALITEHAWRSRRYLLRHNFSVFSTVVGRSIDRPLSDVFTVSERPCLGQLDKVERTIPGAHGGFRITGSAWDSDERSGAPAVVFVEDGVVKGIGRFIMDRSAPKPEAREVRRGFVGYVPHGVTMVTAYTLNRNQTSACRIPGDLSLPPG